MESPCARKNTGFRVNQILTLPLPAGVPGQSALPSPRPQLPELCTWLATPAQGAGENNELTYRRHCPQGGQQHHYLELWLGQGVGASGGPVSLLCGRCLGSEGVCRIPLLDAATASHLPQLCNSGTPVGGNGTLKQDDSFV